MRWQDWAWLILVACLFSSSFLFHKIAVLEYPAMTIAAGRVVVAIPVALGTIWYLGLRLPSTLVEWRPLAVMALLGVLIPFFSVAWGMRHIEAGLGGILMATVPILTVMLAPFLTKDEQFSFIRGSGALVGLGGVVLVIGPLALAGFGNYLMGALVVLIAPFGYALSGIFIRRYGTYHPLVLTTGQFMVGSLVLVPLALVQDQLWLRDVTWQGLGSLVAIGLVGTVIPTLLFFPLVRRVGATSSSPLALFIPVFTVLFGAILLHERLPWNTFAGMALILSGAYAVASGKNPFVRKK